MICPIEGLGIRQEWLLRPASTADADALHLHFVRATRLSFSSMALRLTVRQSRK